MNPFDEATPNQLEINTIDRLVAGELGDEERRQLLRNLDAHPDGWKICALAFLEDQAWRSAIGGFANTSRPPASEPASRTRPSRIWLKRLSVAASILALSFTAGFAVRGILRESARSQVAQQPALMSPRASSAPDIGQIREVGWVNLLDGSRGESAPERLPIVSAPGLDEKWLRDQAPQVSEYDRARWERQGYRVQERRELVSVILEDGRRVSIPVDEVAVDYVGQKPL